MLARDESTAKIRNRPVVRIKDNSGAECVSGPARIVDRICSISTNRALSIGQALCHRCVGIPVREASTPVGNNSATRGSGDGPSDPGACAGCGNQLREGQALVALDRQWHVWCFKCHSCDTVLHGEYMGKWVRKNSFPNDIYVHFAFTLGERLNLKKIDVENRLKIASQMRSTFTIKIASLELLAPLEMFIRRWN